VAYAHGALLGLLGVLSDVPWLVLVPVLAFLMLKDAAAIRRTILTALPHHIQLRGHRLFEEMNATLAAYVRAQLIACVVVGTLSGIGFAMLGNPYAILLGVLAAVLEFIPMIGPLVVAVVAVAIAALHDPALAVWTAVFLTVLRGVEDYVIYPRLIGRDIHLHPLVVILAVLAGVELDGIAGIFIAVPLVALGTVAARHWLARLSASALSNSWAISLQRVHEHSRSAFMQTPALAWLYARAPVQNSAAWSMQTRPGFAMMFMVAGCEQ
jgi:predicted PurR-regulated permease PerM